MVVTDVAAFVGTAECPGVVVERARIQDVIDEINLQQLPAFDPSTAVRPRRLIRDNATVSGTLVESGGNVTLTATYTDHRPGHSRSETVSVQGSGESIFALEQLLAAKLREVICPAPIKHIEGIFNMSFDYGPVLTYAGNVKFDRIGPALFDGADGQLQRHHRSVHDHGVWPRPDRRHRVPAERQQAVRDPGEQRQHQRHGDRARVLGALHLRLRDSRALAGQHDGHHAPRLPARGGGVRGPRVERLPRQWPRPEPSGRVRLRRRNRVLGFVHGDPGHRHDHAELVLHGHAVDSRLSCGLLIHLVSALAGS